MASHESSKDARRAEVYVLSARGSEPEHERAVHEELARRIAALLGARYGGRYDAAAPPAGRAYAGRAYFVPSDTIVGLANARQLKLASEHDLFGGIVPHPFVATKAITHAVLREDSRTPAGWSRRFGDEVRDSVLSGYSAFTLDDALEAGEALLSAGPVRIKPVLATAGRGQILVESRGELLAALERQQGGLLETHGLVLEEHLEDVKTYSVGRVAVGGLVASYVGTQSLTRDNHGELVYGGSTLTVARGEFEALLLLALSEEERLAIAKARRYDEAATRCFAGFTASRRNYDIAGGSSRKGEIRCGVLEQSWRIGGASAAEIMALQAFAADRDCKALRAQTLEIFGTHEAPEGAQKLFQGVDPDIGLISKYVRVQAYGN
ncbi:MAG: DUF3182 family protein [Alcaligenaceae bacterium]|nr:DUF3182 family protein [Alcaligenaceae bacterium]